MEPKEAPPFDLPGHLTVFEFRTRLKGGNTKPLLVSGEDEHGKEKQVVLKVRSPDTANGHYRGTSLACELICSVIARTTGLPVPDYFIATIPRELAECIPDAETRELLRRNTGPNFGCLYHPNMGEWVPDAAFRSSELRNCLDEILSFDATVVNGDRTRKKPNLLCRGDDLLLIDHSLALPVFLWPPDMILESPLFPTENIVNHCTYPALKGHGHSFSSFGGKWSSMLNNLFWRKLREIVPPSWEKENGDLDTIFSFLQKRRDRLAAISETLERTLK